MIAVSVIVNWSSLEEDWSSIPAYVVPAEAQLKVPLPFVVNAWPLEPSAVGSVYVISPDCVPTCYAV